jgi:hypothetical protein
LFESLCAHFTKHKKIKIYTKILFNEILKYTRPDTASDAEYESLKNKLKFENMNFLSTKSDKVIQLSIDNNVDLVFTQPYRNFAPMSDILMFGDEGI